MSEEPERRNADHQLFRELVDEMQSLGDRVQHLVERMEQVALLAQKVDTAADEIKALRLNTESLRERISRIEGPEGRGQHRRDNGSNGLKPATIAGIIGLVAAAVTGILSILQHALEIARSLFVTKP